MDGLAWLISVTVDEQKITISNQPSGMGFWFLFCPRIGIPLQNQLNNGLALDVEIAGKTVQDLYSVGAQKQVKLDFPAGAKPLPAALLGRPVLLAALGQGLQILNFCR
jgi:hypothetical protein